MQIGTLVRQPEGYTAFIPAPFPQPDLLRFTPEILAKAAQAERLIGRLDGVAHSLPDVTFFLEMFMAIDATSSAQIEGTKATMMDALELKAGVAETQTDADDIWYYIRALHYGLARLKDFPFSLRFMRELHGELMQGARSSHFADPGAYRRSQNWIGGTSPSNAAFVPPPPAAMELALNDLEKFINRDDLMPVLQAGILHAQFETIHPFLDGNGRTGRLMISLFLYQRAILEQPVLFLSEYFRKHQQLYYQKLQDYHNNKVEGWLHFYLDGVIATATKAISITKQITELYKRDMLKIHALGKREAGSGVRFLEFLFKEPLVSVSLAAKGMDFTRAGAAKLLERFVDLGILYRRSESERYGRTYIYKDYVAIFNVGAM